MSKFKLGDRVRGTHSHFRIHSRTAIVIPHKSTQYVRVRFDDGYEDGYDAERHHIELVTNGDTTKMARRTFRQLKETVDTEKGALWQEACDDGTQEYILLDYSYHKGSTAKGTSYQDRKLVEEQPQWFIEVFQVEPQYMTREELDQWEAFNASRPAKVKVTPKSDTAASTTVSQKYTGISEERIAKFVRAYNGSRSIKAVAEKMKIGHGTVYSYKHVAVKRGHTLKSMKRVRAAKKAA